MVKITLIEKIENNEYTHNVTRRQLRYMINDIRFNGLNYAFKRVRYECINDTYTVTIQHIDCGLKSAVGIDKYIPLKG